MDDHRWAVLGDRPIGGEGACGDGIGGAIFWAEIGDNDAFLIDRTEDEDRRVNLDVCAVARFDGDE